MRIRFQADADFNNSAVLGIARRRPAIDVRSAAQGLIAQGMPDPEVLALAADAGRVLLTHDVSTMPGHFADFIKHRHSPGVILVPQSLPVASIIESVYLAWSRWHEDELRDSCRWLPR